MARLSKSFIKRTVFALLTAFATLFAACDTIGMGYETYIGEPFFANVVGNMDGIDIEADIYYDPIEHKTKEIYEKLIVSFTAPKSLEGITVTLLSSGEGFARLDGIISDEPMFAELARPFLALSPSIDPNSVKYGENGEIIVTYIGDGTSVTYTFDRKYMPQAVQGVQNGRKFSFIVSDVRSGFNG